MKGDAKKRVSVCLISSFALLCRPTASAATPPPSLPKVPPDWRLEVVAQAPAVKHPSVVACAPDGRVFVAEDPMDISLPKADLPEGRILCLHPDGHITVFADRLHAVFGMQYLEGKLYVLHAPKFSVFTDDNGVGLDRLDLIESLNPNPWALDWNDHVPANFRLAMDGFLYVATGDKGVYGAVGRDGKRVDLHGGGILRLRPDGTGLAVYSTGVRNILDVAINAEDELFTYDNTDEQQWMSRVTHMVDGGFYGYPYDFIPRQPYTLWMMADYGGGAATGVFAYNEDALPAEYRGNLFLADFGKRQVLRLRIERDGATYKVLSREDLFSEQPDDFRPVGIALAPDGLGIYICDWQHRDTKEDVSVGRLLKLSYTGKSVAALKPDWYLPAAMGQKVAASNEELLKGLSHPSQGVRSAAQRELSRRGTNAVIGLRAILDDHRWPELAREHALWVLAAIDPRAAASAALILARMSGSPVSSPAVVRQAIRLLGEQRALESASVLRARLEDTDASIRFRAATALGRIADTHSVNLLIDRLSDPDSFVRFGAFTALSRIGRSDQQTWPAIVKGLQSADPRIREGVAFALRETYEPGLVQALIEVVRGSGNPVETRVVAVELLALIHRQRPEWKGEWWAYHPVNSPPPAKSVEWESTPMIGAVLVGALDDRDQRVRMAAVDAVRDIRLAGAAAKLRDLYRTEADPMLKRKVLAALGALKDAAAIDLLRAVIADPKGNSTLLDAAVAAAESIGTPESAGLLVEFLHSRPAEKPTVLRTIAALGKLKGRGAVVALTPWAESPDAEIRQAAFLSLTGIGGQPAADAVAPLLNNSSPDIRRGAVIALGEMKARSVLPSLLMAYQDPATKWEAIAALARVPAPPAADAYLDGLAAGNPTVRTDCRKAIESIRDQALPVIEARLNGLSAETVAALQKIYAGNDAARKGRLFEVSVKKLEPADYLEFALKHDGDAAHGRAIFSDANGVACLKCHRVVREGGDVGPDLSGAGAQFGRAELAESVLFPSKAIREGYQRVEVETKDEETFEGLVKAETNDTLTLRDAKGGNRQIAKADIKDRRNSQLSLMPEGLESGMTPEDFADLVAYLVSLKGRP